MSPKASQRFATLMAPILVVVGIFVVCLSTRSSNIDLVESEKPFLLPPKDLKHFVLGYNEIAADTLWLRVIQDFDFCENRPKGASNTAVICENGWVYHMIDAVTALAPQFRQPYLSGATVLTVVVNDIAGASLIFDKAVAQFPEDGQIAYHAAYQALIEEKNESKAADLLVRAGKHGAPPWVFSLAAKLKQRSGQLEFSRSILLEAKEMNLNGVGAERIQKRLDEVNAEIAKQQAVEQKH